MPLVSRRFTGQRLTGNTQNWTAEESWDVVGVSDKDAALDAVGVNYGDEHVDNPYMQANSFEVASNKGPLAWVVKWTFKYGDPGNGAEDPLHQPYILNWEFTDESYPVDKDLQGNPIVNSAGDPYDPPPTRTRKLATLVVIRNEPFFSASTALAYMDHVNSDAFSIAGAGGVGVQQAYCQSIRPASSYRQNAKYVPVEYRFSFKPETKDGQTNTNPWQLHVRDQGRNGFYNGSSTSGKDKFIYSGTVNGDASVDVMLDGTGQPIQASLYYVGKKGNSPVANPAIPKGFEKAAESVDGTSYFQLWANVPLIDFSALGL